MSGMMEVPRHLEYVEGANVVGDGQQMLLAGDGVGKHLGDLGSCDALYEDGLVRPVQKVPHLSTTSL